MTTKQVRWRCPHCEHGLLAPSRPRKNDVRRYCLPCSAQHGRLVERIAPSLEKQRTQRAALVQQKQTKKRQRIAKQLQPAKDEQRIQTKRLALITKEAERIWRLMDQPAHRLPTIKLVHSRNRGASGFAEYYRNTITLRLPRWSIGGEWEWVVLAHELCHLALGMKHSDEGSHGRAFYQLLRSATEKRWKIQLDYSFVNGYTNSSKSWGYQVDHGISNQLRKSGKVVFELPSHN